MMSHRPLNGRRRQTGVALISVLLIIALCVIVAAQISTTQRMSISRSQNLFERQQAFEYAMGAEAFVKATIEASLEDNDGKTSLDQPWAMKGMAFPVNGGVIEGQVRDLYSCFNVNALWQDNMDEALQKKRRELFVRLLEKLNVDAEISHTDLANNIYDWIDPDDYATEAVGYDGDMYTSLEYPYLSANSALAHENELRVIYGFNPIVLDKIKKHVCAIPQHHGLQININTIDEENPELLMAMLDIDESTAQSILSERPEEGFEDMEAFWQLQSVASINNIASVDKSYFTVSSKFFKLITNASYNDVKFALTSLIQMDDSYKGTVIGRRFGGEIEREADPEDEQSNK
ncbi:type II secretion system minor pseudopilin GspK [Psychrosphaera ytuae]|uniref:Type II secretion system protein K n=1 Tax=Psychrosphaera ytuae TaxID=2820710 RepID=A0A975D985_9GAMM|nr:type II secretion system minor pseudopilin GspK [Psychrosphaera ytuae]QTH62871.1 type II secretion system minor pseudopilin GspK [Psychrosphaera ytuae]